MIYIIVMEDNKFKEIVAHIKESKPYLIGLGGIPGAGKSTYAAKLQKEL